MERSYDYDGLFRFSFTEYGPPIKCGGMVTQEFDRVQFGTLRFHSSGDVTFERERMPPSVLIVTLSRRGGFDDPARVQEAVRTHTSADRDFPALADVCG